MFIVKEVTKASVLMLFSCSLLTYSSGILVKSNESNINDQVYCEITCENSVERCIDHHCYCQPNYILNKTSGLCQYHGCSSSEDICHKLEDLNLKCNFPTKECICADDYHPDKGNDLECVPTNEVTPAVTWATWWIYVVVILVWTLFLLCLVFVCHKCRRYKKRRYFTNVQASALRVHQDESPPRSAQVNPGAPSSNPSPYDISPGQRRSMFDIFQLLQMFRPNYFEPPPSYDTVPGARPQNDTGVQFINHTQLDSFDNQIYFEYSNMNRVQPSEPVYQNLPAQSTSQTIVQADNRSPTKLEQLNLQL